MERLHHFRNPAMLPDCASEYLPRLKERIFISTLRFSPAEFRSDRGVRLGLGRLFPGESYRDGPYGLATLAVGSVGMRRGKVGKDTSQSDRVQPALLSPE